MACKCCQQYAPKHHDGSPQGPCAGDAAIEEAREWAKLWRQRAIDKGYDVVTTEMHAPTKIIMATMPDTETAPLQYPPDSTVEEKLAIHLADCLAKNKDLVYCQGPERHHVIVGSKFWEHLVERGCFHCDALPEVQT